MVSQGQPLLVRRPSSDNSSNPGIEEEDALLTGQRHSKPAGSRHRWREVGLFAWAFIATVTAILLAVVYQHESSIISSKPRSGGWGPDGKPTGKRNLIFMVSDGMGPTSLSLTRSFEQYRSGLPIDDVLVMDRHLIGSSRTRSTSSLITDSAAGATAFSCFQKSYNGAISVLPDHSPCGTVLEAAKSAGYLTGLVVSTRISDATPACFAAHANRREYEDLIAQQLIGRYPLGRTVDLMGIGGRCHFLPNSTSGSCRSDDKDVIAMAKKDGWSYIDNRHDLFNKKADIKLPLLALLANEDIPYEIDRVHVADVYPSQAEMTELALDILSKATKDSEKGFFLMIEGSRIDHAGHANDPAAQVHEVLAHDRAFKKVLEFLENDSTEGVLVSTSDHETGGLATARQLHKTYPQYHWFPSELVNATHSASNLGHQYAAFLTSQPRPDRKQQELFITKTLFAEGLGIHDVSGEEISAIIDAEPMWPPSYLFADAISRRAQVGWSTHGHSAVDVNIYASSPKHVPSLIGNHENTDVGKFLAEYLDVDVDAITQELRKKGVKQGPDGRPDDAIAEGQDWGEWMGPIDLPDEEHDNLHVDEYHGDFKSRKRSELESCGCGMKH